MENAGQIRWITRYKPQRALVIESLKTIEQLPGDFQVRLHPQPHEYQLTHIFWRANGERCRPDAGDCKIRLDGCTLGGTWLSFPDGQTLDRAPFEILVLGDCTDHLRKTAAGLGEVELFCHGRLVRRERAGGARSIPPWGLTRNG